ncbi:MAG: iron-sulfur cluster assembly accessory protein [Balneolaceae bacterium]
MSESAVSEITISDRAAERIREIQREQGLGSDAVLRVSVRSGGCSGLTYDLDFVSSSDIEKGDHEIEDQGIRVAVDMRSYLYLAGTRLDYTSGLTGKGFHFDNPNASRTCSCGESFSL